MIISVINHTNGSLSDATVQHALRAVNRQLHEDFEPHWGMTATLRLEGRAGLALPRNLQPSVDMRGDAVIYLWHPTNIRQALGYHATNFLGIPYGFVFPEVALSVGESWTVSLSHEALEMVVDPDVNLLVMGPHPSRPGATVFHWYEVCDAVQSETYQIDGIDVSNFVLPLYFTEREEPGSRNDFLRRSYSGRGLPSFSANPGGYVGYTNPATGQNGAFFLEGDTVAARRMQIKQQLGLTRRSQRYRSRATGQPLNAALKNFLTQG